MPRKNPGRKSGLAVVRRAGTAILYLRGTVRGQRVYESAGTDRPDYAEEARAAREAELYRRAIHDEKPRVAFVRAVLSYLETEARPASTKKFVGRLASHFGPTLTCDAIDQAAIDGACRALCRPDAKPATRLRNVITPAKAVLMHAARRGWCPPPRFERTRASPGRTDWFTPAEAEAMIAAAAGGNRRHLRPLLVFLFCTGARLGEAVALDWQDVDLPNARATLRGVLADGTRGTKSGADRIVDLPPRCVAELAALPHRAGPVFHSRGPARAPYRRTQASRTVPYGGQIRGAWAGCLKAADIERKLTPHHARHTWASWHYAIHKDAMRLRQDGGWSSIQQVERYAKLIPPSLEDAVRHFWGLQPPAHPTKKGARHAR